MMQKQVLSRRKFLKRAGLVAVSASAATLAACAPTGCTSRRTSGQVNRAGRLC